MKIKDITNYLEEVAPLKYAEDFDNVGLLIGSYNTEVTGVLVTLDTLEDTIDEAIAKNCNFIISFHPIIFGGLKKLNGKNYVERVQNFTDILRFYDAHLREKIQQESTENNELLLTKQ